MLDRDHERVVEQLSGSDAVLRSVLDASSRVSIIVTDLDGVVRIFNEGARVLLGYESEEVVGKQTPTLIHLQSEVEQRSQELSEEFGYPVRGFEVFVAHAKQGRYEEREWTYVCKNGEHRWVNLAVTAVHNEQDEIIGFLGTAVDTTERRRAEERLRRSEQLFRQLFHDSADALLLLEEGQFVDCNDGTIRMLRARNKGEVLNTPPWELSPEHQMDGRSSHEKALEMIGLALEHGSHRFEWLHCRMDGEVFPVEVLLTAITIGERRVLHTCWRDISDRKRAEEQLRQSQKMEVVGQLAGGIAHDFNNMLAAIVGGADLLTADLQGEVELLEHVSMISDASSRAADLTSKLLAFARKGAETMATIDLHEVVRAAQQLFARTLDKRVEIVGTLAAKKSMILGDSTELQNAVINLGINARDAMRSGGRLTLATENVVLGPGDTTVGAFTLAPGDYVRLTVSDTGQGIEPNLLPRIFEPFFTTKGVGEGTGLGLASVYGTVKSHCGSVSVDSTVGEGTRFQMHLPIADGPSDRDASPRPTSDTASEGGMILVVDDEPLVRSTLSKLLHSAGYSTLVAEGVEQAETIFAEHWSSVDAVLLDMIMPKHTGREGFHRLRAIDPDARILLVSGFTRGEEVTDLIEQGLAGFVRKPVRRADLIELLRQTLRAPR